MTARLTMLVLLLSCGRTETPGSGGGSAGGGSAGGGSAGGGSAGGVVTGGGSAGGVVTGGGSAGGGSTVCTPGSNPSCNDDPNLSSIAGECLGGRCRCNTGFVLNPTTGRCRVLIPCDPVRQNCVDPSTSCYPRIGGTSACLPTGRGLEGAPCMNPNDCTRGAFCAGRNHCHRVCTTSASCDPGQSCTFPGSAFSTEACVPPGSYQACALIAALDRLIISREQPASGRCTVVRLVNNGSSTPGVMLPPGWAIEGVSTSTSGPCPDIAATGVPANAVTGSISFQGTPPASLIDRLELRLGFPADGGTAIIELGAERLSVALCP